MFKTSSSLFDITPPSPTEKLNTRAQRERREHIQQEGQVEYITEERGRAGLSGVTRLNARGSEPGFTRMKGVTTLWAEEEEVATGGRGAQGRNLSLSVFYFLLSVCMQSLAAYLSRVLFSPFSKTFYAFV